MAFALLSKSQSKTQGSVKPVPKQKSARGQRPADSRFGFAKPGFQPQPAALPTAPVIQTKLKVGELDDEFEQEADRMAELTGNDNGSISPSAAAQSRSPATNPQHLYGSLPVLQMRNSSGGLPAPSVPLRPSQGGILQRKCACGGAAGMSGECEECSQKTRLGLQAKLKVNEPGDIYEQEADRIADQVLATPAHSAVSGAPPRIQRFAGQPNGQMDAAPASVEQALSSPGRSLEPTLRQDMEQRFGYDFSQVRVHSGVAAEQSARGVNAYAYTVGHNIVFGAGRFSPATHEGRRLLAHELTHVVQQSGSDAILVDQSDEKRGLSPISRPINNTLLGRLQRREAGSHSPALGTAAEYTGPGWTTVNKLGIVRVEEATAKERGARLRQEPSTSPGVKVIHHLDENTRVLILAQNEEWRYVLVDNKQYRGSLGYVRDYLIWTGLPDPDAVTYYIAEAGLGLQKLVENHPQYKDYDIRTGDDARSIVMAVLVANEGDSRTEKGVYLNQAKLAEASDPGAWEWIKDAADKYRRVLRPILQSVELRLGEKIWLPGKSYIQALKGKGIIPTRPEWKNVAIAAAKGIGGFVAGLVEGFGTSIADVFIGIYELIKSVISFVVDLISGKAIEAAEEFYDTVKEMSPGELFKMLKDALVQMISSSVEEFSRKWNADNTYNRWNYRGYVIGYILAEVLLLIFTAGTATIAKWLGKLGKLGQKLLKVLDKVLGKVDDLLDKVPGRKHRKKDAGDVGEKGDAKARELPAALTLASAIAETHDAQDSPVSAVLLSLAPLKRRYKWIDKFDADRTAPGHYQIVMYGSRHIIDEDYTTEVGEELTEPVRVEPRARGFAIEDRILSEKGYSGLPDYFPSIDGYKADPNRIKRIKGWRTIEADEVVSVKSTKITNAKDLKEKISKDLDKIKRDKYKQDRTQTQVICREGCKKNLTLVFEQGFEGQVIESKEILKILARARRQAKPKSSIGIYLHLEILNTVRPF
jgi:hypothetical protein